jgi:hypothetical protein
MNLALREHRRLRAEALDYAAHEQADAGGGDQHRRFAFARRGLEASRTSVMNSDSFEGCMASWRSSPWPTRSTRPLLIT